MFGIAQGLQTGGALGTTEAALNAGSLANKAGAFGTSSSNVNGALGAAGGALGVYNGIQQGGISGYGGATVGALRAGSGLASLAGNSQLAGTLGSAAGYIAAPLSVYNLVKNWQSGNTAGDAINGAEAGASIGSIIPGLGTVIGGLIGGAVGALSSAFGGGKVDPESANANSLDAAVKSGNASQAQVAATMANPATSYQYLAGIMDAKNNTAGHSQPIEQVFGREGEQNMVDQMTQQINTAISSGQISKTASPTQIYNQIVSPWLTSKGAAINPNSVDSGGNNEGQQLIQSLIGLIGSWQNGSLTSSTKVGVSGQPIAGLASYGTGGSSNTQQAAVGTAIPAARVGNMLL